MHNTQKTAMQRAVQLLVAAGVDFAIITPEGEKLGNLEVKTKKPKKVRPSTYKRTGINYRPMYKDQLDMLPAGEVAILRPQPGVNPESLRGTAVAYAIHKYGKGNVISTIIEADNDKYIEILRVA